LELRDRKAIAILALILVVLLGTLATIVVLGYMPGPLANAQNDYIAASPYHGLEQINATLANTTLVHQAPPSYVTVMKQNRTLVFHSTKITIMVFAFPNYEAGALLNQSIPDYDCNQCPNPSNPIEDAASVSNSFAIYGLINPTMIIPKGAILNITFINMDSTDHHNFVLTTFPPPFPVYIMQNMAKGGEMVDMTPLLDPINSTANTVAAFPYTVNLDLPPSVTQMWYMCMFPSHAMFGMWGNITLVNPSSVGA
jgi:rusticyanin